MGFVWTLVAACGTGIMRIVQRSNAEVSGTVLMLWGYILNTLLWLPPGSIPPKLRVPGLWPAVPQDSHDVFAIPATSWAIMATSGCLGAAVMASQGHALKHLDVATYSIMVTPLSLVLNVLYSSFQKPQGTLVWVGIVLQVMAMLADVYQTR